MPPIPSSPRSRAGPATATGHATARDRRRSPRRHRVPGSRTARSSNCSRSSGGGVLDHPERHRAPPTAITHATANAAQARHTRSSTATPVRSRVRRPLVMASAGTPCARSMQYPADRDRIRTRPHGTRRVASAGEHTSGSPWMLHARVQHRARRPIVVARCVQQRGKFAGVPRRRRTADGRCRRR